MRFDIMTLFPDMVRTVLEESILGRAQQNGCIEIHTHQIRDYSLDRHHRVDDTPYGGGKGMLMGPEPIWRCYEAVCRRTEGMRRRVVYMSPQGKVLTQRRAEALTAYDNLIILCGHYEGVDQRILDEIADEEISIGNYVLTGGELPACILVDSISRLLPGVLSDAECYENDSISCGMLEYPQYTRPPVFHGKAVPQVLLDGNHQEIAQWRYRMALKKTKKQRPDLL